MKRRSRYLLCGLAAAGMLTAVFLAGKQNTPQDDLTVRTQSANVRAMPQNNAQTTKTAPAQTTKTAASETGTTAAETTESTAATALIRDLNQADVNALMRVQGIGEKLASEIIACRDAHGGFTRRSQLMEIYGIGETLMESIMREFEIVGELPEPETAAPPETLPPETEPPETSAETTQTSTVTTEALPPAPQNLNEIGREALLEIPGMTEALADQILDLRGQIGEFRTVFEIALLDGIGEAFITETLCPYLYVEGDTYFAAMTQPAAETAAPQP